MTHNLNYGDRVAHILNGSPIWAEFKDQKHDLFITDTNVRGYLTGTHTESKSLTSLIFDILFAGAPTQTAGYLTAAPSKNVEVLTSPPPIDRDDPLARPTE